MSSVCFYLKKATKRRNAESKESLIYLQYRRNNEKFTYTFGQTISPSKWSINKQRAKLNSERCVGRKEHLNDLLNSLSKVVENAVKNGITGNMELKNTLDKFLDQNENKNGKDNGFYNLIDKFLANEIKVFGKDKKPGTIRSYQTTLRHLKEFEHIKKVELNFDRINLDFYNQFVTFLRERNKFKHKLQLLYKEEKRQLEFINLADNAIGKDIKNIKTFMNEALDQGIIIYNGFSKKRIKAFNEPGESVSLSEKEILKLYRLDLSDNKRLEAVRDLFVFSCWVGLRYSDLTNIKPENIISENGKGMLRIKMIKTGDEVKIPIDTHIVKEIFKKYSHMPNSLPPFISDVNYNLYIKEACKLAGLTEKKRLSKKPHLELWQAIASHTGRRSFATNVLSLGAHRSDIMKVTGHKTESSFNRYINLDTSESAKRVGEVINKGSSQIHLAATA